MRAFGKILAIGSTVLLSGCAATGPAPVTAEFSRESESSEAQLREGRALFVARCIECHTLPNPRRYARDQWPMLVGKMASRASLSLAEKAAIIAYVQAASVTAR